MSAWKTLALGIVLLATSSRVVQADPISSPNQFNWVVYFAGGNGNVPAAVSTSVAAATASPAPAPVPVPVQAAAPQPAPSEPVAIAPRTVIANAPIAAPMPIPLLASTPSPTSGPVDAYINLGNGPYPLANTITAGGAQAWYDSSQITSLFGGQPNAQQIQSFDNAILQRVQQTFSQSGVSVSLSDTPNVPALHTLSLVSNTTSASLSSAIGMTQVGSSGFSFIDNIASSAQSVDQLEWIVAHNISHELMLAFGVPENYDQSGSYIDSKVANWAMMVSSSSTFSPAASQALSLALASAGAGSTTTQLGAQSLSDNQVPEPTTLAVWALAGAGLMISARRRGQSRARAGA